MRNLVLVCIYVGGMSQKEVEAGIDMAQRENIFQWKIYIFQK